MLRRGVVGLFFMAIVAGGLPLAAAATAATASVSPVAQDRSVEAVVLNGSQFPGWSAGPEISAREPTQPINSDCTDDEGDGLSHNCSESSRIPNNPNVGAAVDRLGGYRWNASAAAFEPIRFQVDERFTRYISNLASNCTEAGPFCVGFGAYSGADAQLSYVFDRDAYKYIAGECDAEMKPGSVRDTDPVKGLDDNDEIAFMYSDAGGQAPPGAQPPDGVGEMRKVRIADPSAPDLAPRYVYVGLATASAPPAYDATNGYVRYIRDADADRYEETSDNYGNAPKGPICDSAGNVIKNNEPRRPRDTAWVLTPRYAFRYEGRWILRGIRVAPGDRDEPLDSPDDYGPPLVDQWKARAYAQTPESETPCCGFQTEQDDWGDSSVTVGERAGPVRVIRTTWGSNSGTNTLRNEILYPEMIVQQTNLRVHPMPPLGGIFSYWDHTAGVITKYYNPQRPEGVDVDGRNDEVVGTTYIAARPGGVEVRDDDDIPVVGPQDVSVGTEEGCLGECADFDVTDPTLNAVGTLTWEQVSGEFGSMVFKTGFNETSPGNAQSLATIPYYRDDSCFDDGTGIDPGPHTNPGGSDPVRPCWEPGDAAPDPGLRQGLIGAHGVQIMFAAETDNLMLTVPVNEISAQTRMVVLPGDPGNVGERYAHADDLPLLASAVDEPAIAATTITVTGETSGRIGGTADLAATLTDAVGPVANAPLRFSLQGMTYNATTDAEGKAAVDNVPIAGPPGPADLVVTYDGDGVRSPDSETVTFTVEKGDTTIDFEESSDTSGKVNHTAQLAAKLTDASGPVANAAVEFAFQGASHQATTDANGIASKDVGINGPAGDTDLTVSFAGDGTRSASSDTTTFAVERDDSAVAFEPSSASSGRIGNEVTFSAKLTDSSGPVDDAPLHFDFQGVTYDGVTGDDGVASVQAVVTGPAGDTTVAVRSDADTIREASSASAPFTVTARSSAITFTARTGRNSTVLVEATLTDGETGVGLGGRDVQILVNGKLAKTVQTDDNGLARASFRVSKPRGKVFRVEFSSDGTYAGSAAEAAFGKNGASGSS